jgi:UPF0755 protein
MSVNHSSIEYGSIHLSRRKFPRYFKYSLLALIIIILFLLFQFNRLLLISNTVEKPEDPYLYIRTGSTFGEVMASLEEKGFLRNPRTFRSLAAKFKYGEKIKAGRYLIGKGMSNYELLKVLIHGEQTPVRLVFNNIRTKAEFASRISRQIEADSITLMKMFSQDTLARKYGLTTENILTLFIPNTYELYWNISPARFFDRMNTEHEKFWNDNRVEKARALGLSPSQVAILASIVEKETTHDEEKSDIARVYLNRLKRGMKLQADPTVVFATGDFSIQRVLHQHIAIDSPYNTYKYSGLPPGPICLPSISSLEAVLDARPGNNLFLCAREDLSGYHNFAITASEHMINARKYQQALNRLHIRK